ncbi:hypothetical protein [Actinacidiphila oryziradicis]|jgi:hypothetical protein|uniref:hypothetical protein n=1 Tax=Actinacidiphila oryziradicis TaxID=2571141 RepID=UPI0023F0CC48|nr:hypothetical protein [Actinacidiphila oryziradicis]MCW2875018.1 hypothetical protein [Actinacidiphila oryziradicis]
MRIELTWTRADAANGILAIPVPEAPINDLLRPALHHARRAWNAAAVRRALSYAEPAAGIAADAAGAGILVQLALPFAVRLAQQALGNAARGGDGSSTACAAPPG